MSIFRLFGTLAVVGLVLSACATPPVAPAPPPAAPVIGSYTMNADSLSNLDHLTWVLLEDGYTTKFADGTTLCVGYSWPIVHWLTWSDGGYYTIGTEEPNQGCMDLPITFFPRGQVAVIEKDGKPVLYFKYEGGGNVYMAKGE